MYRRRRGGFELAAAEPEQAAELLLTAYPEQDADLIRRSQLAASPNYRDAGKPWGVIDGEIWATYGRYLHEHGFVTGRGGEAVTEPDWEAMHTTAFLT